MDMSMDDCYIKYGQHITPLRPAAPPAATVCSPMAPKEGSLLSIQSQMLRTPVSSPFNSSIYHSQEEPLDLSYQNQTWSEISYSDLCNNCSNAVSMSYDDLFSQFPNQDFSSRGSSWKGEVTNTMHLEIGRGKNSNNSHTSHDIPVRLYERDHFHSSINDMQVVHSSPHPVSNLCFNSQDINTTIDTYPYSSTTNQNDFPWNVLPALMPGPLPYKPNLTWSQDISLLDLPATVSDSLPCSPVAEGGCGGSTYLTDVGHNDASVNCDVGSLTSISGRMSTISSIISPVTQREESDVWVTSHKCSTDQSQDTKGSQNNPIILNDESEEISCGQGQGLRKQSEHVRPLGQRQIRPSLSRACKRNPPRAKRVLGVVSSKKPRLVYDEATLDAIVKSWESMPGSITDVAADVEVANSTLSQKFNTAQAKWTFDRTLLNVGPHSTKHRIAENLLYTRDNVPDFIFEQNLMVPSEREFNGRTRAILKLVSQRGQEIIICSNGHSYNLRNDCIEGCSKYYRCRKKKSTCKAKIEITTSGAINISDTLDCMHNHPSSYTHMAQAQYLQELRRLAIQRPFDSPTTLITELLHESGPLRSLVEGIGLGTACTQISNLRQLVRAVRRRSLPPPITGLWDFIDLSFFPVAAKNFIKFDLSVRTAHGGGKISRISQ